LLLSYFNRNNYGDVLELQQSHANGAGPLEEATVNATEIDERAASYQAATNEMAELAAEAMREVPSTSTPATPCSHLLRFVSFH
jgi:hypothetical protein